MIEYIGKCLLLEEDSEKILVAGDLHLGYEESLNRAGVLVSRNLFKEMIEYFERVFSKIGNVDQVILLGDVKHNFGSILWQEWDEIPRLLDYLSEKCRKIILIKGNHDVIFQPIVKGREVLFLDFYIFKDFCFLHGDKDFPEIHDSKIKYWIVGHGHPAVKLRAGVKIEKYKCYLVGKFKRKKIIILPSFFEGSEGSDPRENDLGFAWKFNLLNFEVKIVGEKLEILDFGKLGKLE